MSWVVSVICIIVSILFLFMGYALTAAACLIIGVVILPPINKHICNKMNVETLFKRPVLMFFVLFFGLCILISQDQNLIFANAETQKQVELAQQKKEQRAKMVQEFTQNREKIISEITNFIIANEFEAAIKLSKKYVALNDPKIMDLSVQAEKAYQEHRRIQETKTLLASLKDQTESEAIRIRNIYTRLSQLKPENQEYAEKLKHYTDKAAQQKREKAAKIKKINAQIKIKEEKERIDKTKYAIKLFCADKWLSDYRMQKYCIDNQNKAFKNMQRKNKSSIANSILSRCMEKWHKYDYLYDWTMVEYCKKNQIEAFRSIHR